MKFRLSPRAALVIIAALFVLPLVAAWLMYTGAIDYQPGTTRNLGDLVRPAVPVDWSATTRLSGEAPDAGEADFERHWVVLHDLPSPCDSACLETVTALRQVHRAAGRNQSRIRLALLLPEALPEATAAELTTVYDRFRLLQNPGGELRQALEVAGSRAGTPTLPGNSYLVDPLGNIMMVYAAGSDPNHLKKDLKRLLTWSKLDESS